jgi:hypothetical protein
MTIYVSDVQEKDRQLKHTVDAYNQLKGVSSTVCSIITKHFILVCNNPLCMQPLAARRGSDIMSTSSSSTHGESFSSKGLASISSALSIPKLHASDRSTSPATRVPGGAGPMRSETPLSSRPRSSEASMRSMDILKSMAAARSTVFRAPQLNNANLWLCFIVLQAGAWRLLHCVDPSQRFETRQQDMYKPSMGVFDWCSAHPLAW